MKVAEITQKNDKELMAIVADGRKQLVQLAIDMRTKKAGNVKQIAAVKKTTARALTVLRQRQLKQEENHG